MTAIASVRADSPQPQSRDGGTCRPSGLALMPAYWSLWRNPEHRGSRRAVTTILLLVTWWNFVVGHVVNNLRGL